jgi:hypothetical protein
MGHTTHPLQFPFPLLPSAAEESLIFNGLQGRIANLGPMFRPLNLLSILWWMWISAALSGAGGGFDRGHPMDGPDVELRIQRTQLGLRVALRANLVFLDETLGSFRELPNEIAPEEQAQLEQRVLEWLEFAQLLRVDGKALGFKRLNAAWVPADPERVPYFPREGERALTYLDLRLEFVAPGDIDRLSVAWDAFPINPVLAMPGTSIAENAPTIEVKAVLMAGPEERIVTLTKESPTYVWRLPQGNGADHLLPVPAIPEVAGNIGPRSWLALALGAIFSAFLLLRRNPTRLLLAVSAIGAMFFLGRQSLLAAPVDWNPTAAEAVFRSLHGNLYRAFDFHENEAVYDALAASVEGDLLEELYREIHTSLIMEEEEGALCRVEAVEIEALDIGPLRWPEPLQFEALCRWQVLGVVHHWGHSHQRRLRWKARFDVRATDAGWRITGAHILATERLPIEDSKAAPTGRTF